VVIIEPVYSSLQLPGLNAVFGAWHASPRLERMVHRARLDRRRKTELRNDSVVDILVAQSLVGALPSNRTAASADCVPAVDSLFTVAAEVSMDACVGFPCTCSDWPARRGCNCDAGCGCHGCTHAGTDSPTGAPAEACSAGKWHPIY